MIFPFRFSFFASLEIGNLDNLQDKKEQEGLSAFLNLWNGLCVENGHDIWFSPYISTDDYLSPSKIQRGLSLQIDTVIIVLEQSLELGRIWFFSRIPDNLLNELPDTDIWPDIYDCYKIGIENN